MAFCRNVVALFSFTMVVHHSLTSASYCGFLCADGECVSSDAECDGVRDCSDGSDEHGCIVYVCRYGEIKCDNDRCIPKSYKCDNVYDCDDHTDEKDCGASSGLAIGLAVGVTTLLAIVSIVVIALACFYRARKLRHLRARYCVLTEAVQAATFLAALDVSPIDPPSNEPQNEGEGGAVSGAPPSYTAALYEASLPQQQDIDQPPPYTAQDCSTVNNTSE